MADEGGTDPAVKAAIISGVAAVLAAVVGTVGVFGAGWFDSGATDDESPDDVTTTMSPEPEEATASPSTSTSSPGTTGSTRPEDPGFAVQPDQAVVGQDLTLTVSGSSFRAGEVVRVMIATMDHMNSSECTLEVNADDCRVLADIMADSSGSFSDVSVVVGSAPNEPGTYFILADELTSHELVSRPLRVVEL